MNTMIDNGNVNANKNNVSSNSNNNNHNGNKNEPEQRRCSNQNCPKPSPNPNPNPSPLLRCSQCQKTYYCSKECQRAHWKAGHRRVCRPIIQNKLGQTKKKSVSKRTTTAKEAMEELGRFLADTTVSEASEKYWRATDEVERLSSLVLDHGKDEKVMKEMEEKKMFVSVDARAKADTKTKVKKKVVRGDKEAPQCLDEGTSLTTMDVDVDLPVKTMTKEKKKNEKKKNENKTIIVKEPATTTSIKKTMKMAFSSGLSTQNHTSKSKVKSNLKSRRWRYAVEKLSNVSCYSITVLPPPSSPQSSSSSSSPSSMDLTSNANQLGIRLDKVYRNSDTDDENRQDATCTIGTRVQILYTISQHHDNHHNDSAVTNHNHSHNQNHSDNNNTLATTTNQTKNITKKKQQHTIILASMRLPHDIITSEQDATLSIRVHSDSFTFRLAYASYDPSSSSVYHNDDDDDDDFPNQELTRLSVLQTIQCRSCHQYLLKTDDARTRARFHQEERRSGGSGSRTSSGNFLHGGSNSSPSGTNSSSVTRNIIDSVLPLPSGYWDEIADYLTCYEGDASVNFSSSSTSAAVGRVLEDSQVLVFHKQDLVNICILAIEGYGEDEQHASSDPSIRTKTAQTSGMNNDNDTDALVYYRGTRPWKDLVGGATVCCNRCCSILGHALIEHTDTIRLLKHRLCADSNVGTIATDSFVRNYSCASFLAREMVRYAETQAVFTFVVAMHSSEGALWQGGNATAVEKEEEEQKMGSSFHHRPCLLLRLVSWSSMMAISKSSSSGGRSVLDERDHSDKRVDNNDADDNDDLESLEWIRVIKVIFQETEDLLHSSNNNMQIDNPTTWVWGGVDLCCPPENDNDAKFNNNDNSNNNSASVRIYISKEEWTELRGIIHAGNSYFSETVSKVTVQMKLGVDGDCTNAGLSMIQLP